MALMTSPLVGVLPCKISKIPWFTPDNNPQNTPMVVAITRVASRFWKDNLSFVVCEDPLLVKSLEMVLVDIFSS
jgi:hypothetical protein